jgi:hypothetical protein
MKATTDGDRGLSLKLLGSNQMEDRKMTILRIVISFLVANVFIATVQAQPITVTHMNPGTVRKILGPNRILNKESTLKQEWITIHDPSIPADFEGNAGIGTVYEAGRPSGSFYYVSAYVIKTREALSAIEIRFLIFDVWGDYIRTLSNTSLADIDSGTSKEINAQWNLFSENEASKFYASISYIARVRTKAGRIVEGNRTAVLTEAKKFSQKFKEEDLEPKREKQ